MCVEDEEVEVNPLSLKGNELVYLGPSKGGQCSKAEEQSLPETRRQ